MSRNERVLTFAVLAGVRCYFLARFRFARKESHR